MYIYIFIYIYIYLYIYIYIYIYIYYIYTIYIYIVYIYKYIYIYTYIYIYIYINIYILLLTIYIYIYIYIFKHTNHILGHFSQAPDGSPLNQLVFVIAGEQPSDMAPLGVVVLLMTALVLLLGHQEAAAMPKVSRVCCV